MRALFIVTCGALLACAATAQTVSEDRLLAEPLWTLQADDGPPVAVWFERHAERLEIVRCTAETHACRSSVELVVAGAIPSTHDALAITVLDGRIPILSAGARTTLFPAWVVPGAGSLKGF